jgi:hypothetical protein
MAVEVITEIIIERPQVEVSTFAVNPDNAPAWYENIEPAEWKTDPPLRLGSKIAFAGRSQGVEVRSMRLLFILILIVGNGYAEAAEPDRSKGLSAHFLPKRAAESDKSSSVKWGFIASTPEMVSRSGKDRPTFQSVRLSLRTTSSSIEKYSAMGSGS